MTESRYDNMHVQVKIVITTGDSKDSPTFGRGAALLLHGVEELGSLNQSAKQLHMAYSKAWKMIHNLEVALGFDLIERHGSAGSTMTDKGRDLLERYEELERSIDGFARREFAENLQTME